MKTGSDFLWRLIRSMTAAEKLYFRRNFVPGKDNLYMKLFRAIAVQPEYDEAAILKKFSPELTRKNLAAQKHYLQQQICEAVTGYDSRDQVGHSIYKDVLLIRTFRKKGLLEEAHAVWKKAMPRARKIESYALVNLLKTEFEKMILFSSLHTHNDELYSIFKGHIISYTGYAEIITLRDIYAETVLLKRQAHFDLDAGLKKKISELRERIEKADAKAYGQSFWFRHYYRMSKATLLYLLNDFSGALALYKEVLLDWKANTDFITTDGEYYVELLYMINYAGVLEGEYEFVSTVFLDRINNLINDPAQKAAFETIRYLALNKIYNKTARYDMVERLVEVMKTGYRSWEPVINTDLNRTVCLSLGIGCFVLEQYTDALYFTRRALTWYKDKVREEHSSVAHILLMLITFSMNNPRLFDAQHKSTYNYFYKRKKSHPFESALVQCLSRTFYMKDNKSKTEAYRKTLALLDKGKNNPVQQMAFAIFNYPAWLESKLHRVKYREYVSRQVKQTGLVS